MPKVSAERFCRQRFPAATIERRRDMGHRTYFRIREHRGSFMPIGDGKTAREAWEKLRARLQAAEEKQTSA